MDGSTLGTILGSIAASGVAGGFINYLANRKKVGADATKIITDAATSVVSSLRARVDELEAREDERDARDAVQKKLLRAHEAWDHQVAEIITRFAPQVNLPPPPPLHPDDA